MNAAWKTKRSLAGQELSPARSSSPRLKILHEPIAVFAQGGDELQVGFEKAEHQFP